MAKKRQATVSYVFKSAFRAPKEADPQQIGERLHALQADNGERLTPRVVVDDARPSESPLHPCFEWDDLRAAELHREEQARSLIRSIRIVETPATEQEPAITVRAFVNVVEQSDEDEPEHGYVTRSRVMAEPELYRQVIQQAVRDLEAFESRYREFKELAGIGSQAKDSARALLEIMDPAPEPMLATA